MRHQFSRFAFLAVAFATPVLMVVAAPPAWRWPEGGGIFQRGSVLPVLAVEVVLLLGFTFAANERRRLLAERTRTTQHRFKLGKATQRPRPNFSRPTSQPIDAPLQVR